MTPKEHEIAIGELEDRLDRLRVLYEQYFLGFEKLEPSVPRKEVDRRFAILRKEQIRNTAVRFRFQVVTQRFNTYQMYWQRICRQIEEGTFKRHLQRARRLLMKDSKAVDLDIDVDVDMTDFEDVDVDQLLADADAAVSAYEQDDADTADTIPPPPSRAPSTDRSPVDTQLERGTPGTAFAIGRRPPKELDTELDEAGAGHAASASIRAARPVAMPAGSKPKIVRRMALHPAPNGTEPPPSGRTLPGVDISRPAFGGSATSEDKSHVSPPPPSVPAARESSRFLAEPGTAPKIAPIRNPAASSPALGSSGRVPVASPAAPSERRIQVANPRLPIPPPSGRLPVAVPPPPTSSPRLPNAPPSSPALTAQKPGANAKPPPSSPNLVEKDAAVPSQRPSMRPPPALPSQHTRPPAKKKES